MYLGWLALSKTRVDDLLTEMITPKIKEIEQKFTSGQGLSQDDINTLLLKSQYNHINHLDDRLNDVTASVQALETKFVGLEGKFQLLENKVLERLDRFEATFDLKIEKAINTNMRWSIGLIAFIVTVLKLADTFLGR